MLDNTISVHSRNVLQTTFAPFSEGVKIKIKTSRAGFLLLSLTCQNNEVLSDFHPSLLFASKAIRASPFKL
jgi:hypothetical protein